MSSLLFELATEPLEVVRGDVAFVFFFEDERPLRGCTGRADWRLCGWLSSLIEAGRMTGARGEALLMPTGGGLRVPLLVALGAGPSEDFDEAAWAEAAGDMVRRSLGLGAASVAVAPPQAGGRLGLRPRIEGLATGAARALGEHPGSLMLRVLADGEEERRATELLKTLPSRRLPGSVSLRISPGPDRHLDRARELRSVPNPP